MQVPPQSEPPLDGLGNHVYLEKQDKLRDIGIDIHTSQIVVVGGQSSGKSSLLESLTGFSFPRGQGLCTRYATQISLRRSPVAGTIVSITPGPESGSKRKQKLRLFRRETDNVTNFQGDALARIIDEASEVMGIRSNLYNGKRNLPMFSSDILKIEISGPEQPHLTVIDVPGLFQVTEEGRTTEADRQMVDDLVRSYMENERTIILAVMSCLADRATESILQLAKAADPKGKRTVGVLTKADLVREKAVYQTILDLVRGKTAQLGYFVVSNRGADQDSLTLAQCKEQERALFLKPEWAAIAKEGRIGVDALREELQCLLTDLARQEQPKQKAEVAKRLSDARKNLDRLGAPRDSPASQRGYLIQLASRFVTAARDAREARYEENAIFGQDKDLKLITHIVTLNQGFSSFMARKGHSRKFESEVKRDIEGQTERHRRAQSFRTERHEARMYQSSATEVYAAISEYPELIDVLPVHEFDCVGPSDDPIMDYITAAYNENRGPELGTFSGSLLATTFREQAKMWESIVHAHLGLVIIAVHRFVRKLLELVVDDRRIREELWESILLGDLLKEYGRALAHAKFVIDVEMLGRPMTNNNSFADDLNKARTERLIEGMQHIAPHQPQADIISIRTDQVVRLAASKANGEQAKEDLHDILESYYNVSLKRLVDTLCRQVIDYFLLSSPQSPLQIFKPERISQLSDAELARIAGEDGKTKRERQRLETEIEGLETAMKVLRG